MHYYQGIRLATIPIKVYPNRKVNDRIFYSEYENAEVVVKNYGRYNKLIIYINNKELTVKLKDELTKVDISRYAEKGENKISYLLPDNDNHNSYVEIHIVVKE